MKKILFLLAIICIACFTNSAFAEITVKQYMSNDFLDAQGYSGELLRLVEVNKAKTFGEKTPDPWAKNPIKRGYQKFFAYLDPATDARDFGTHEIFIDSTWWDY